MNTVSNLPESEHYTPEELDASCFFTPQTKRYMDLNKLQALRQAGFGQAILDFVGRRALGPFFVDPTI
jgi:hypothetical protein